MTETVLRDLEVRAAAADLMHRYQRCVDQKDLDGLAALIVDDVELVRRRRGSGVGREVFLDLYRAFVASDVEVAQHMLTNIQVTPQADDRYRIDACFFVITTHEVGDARMIWGRYSDDMVETDGGWRYAAKRIDVVRTALIPEASLVSGDVNSFGPIDLRA